MKSILVIASLLLSACSTTVPISAKFPPAPSALTKKCSDLMVIEKDKTKITDMLKVVVENYQLYYECAAKVDGWNTWYIEQKKIFDNH